MNAAAALPSLLAEPHRLRTVGSDLYSLLPADAGPQMYDSRAGLYDRVVGSRLYNRIMWGTQPEEIAAFAREALESSKDSWVMDAAGGSLLFTAALYVEARTRPILVLDQSLAMLARARDRLIAQAGRVPEHIVLVQGDLRDLSAFRPTSFGTIVSLNVLHHIDDAAALVANLAALLPGFPGRLYLTSLITTGRWSDRYLKALHRNGIVVAPRAERDVQVVLSDSTFDVIHTRTRGNMLCAWTEWFDE